MKNRFKFRAWVNESRMIDNEELIKKYNILAILDDEIDENLIPMQSTGLHDKNGIEIYEGDIVEFTPDKTFGVVTTFGKSNNLGIEWENSRTSMFTLMFYLGCEKELNILGNIHQNKELLETK